MPSAAENARTIGHHDHGLNSPLRVAVIDIGRQDVFRQLAALGLVDPSEVERDEH